MSGDVCATKTLKDVTIQENGIIRNNEGMIIGRLSDEVTYDSLDKNNQYYEDREEVNFFMGVKMNKRWAKQFIGFMNRLQQLGAVGSSREVTFYADGDGDFRPKFTYSHDIDAAEGKGKERLFFDGG